MQTMVLISSITHCFMRGLKMGFNSKIWGLMDVVSILFVAASSPYMTVLANGVS
jgi:hypothetical protein